MTAAVQAQVRVIVQHWLDSTEKGPDAYPSYRALRDLAVLLRQERGRPTTPARKPRTKRAPK